jgi:hypothetical protein
MLSVRSLGARAGAGFGPVAVLFGTLLLLALRRRG